MCKCVDVKYSTNANTIVLGYYPCMREYRDNRLKAGLLAYGIGIDRCLVEEIVKLWKSEIRTLGCCCGHNKLPGTVIVNPEDIEKIRLLGYKQYIYPDDPHRDDTFLTKSYKYSLEG